MLHQSARRVTGGGRKSSQASIRARNRWQWALKKVVGLTQFEGFSNNTNKREKVVQREDPPGSYVISIRHEGKTDKMRRRRSLLRGVKLPLASKVFKLEHDSQGQHTLRWTTDIVDPEGNTLSRGELNLYQYPMVSFAGQPPVSASPPPPPPPLSPRPATHARVACALSPSCRATG